MSTIPCVQLSAPSDRDYTTIMERTKMVYDQLLIDKNAKLVEALLNKKEEFDSHCQALAQKSGEAEALEYGVRAQEYLNRMQNESEAELTALQKDYQEKLDRMADTMELQWKQKHGK